MIKKICENLECNKEFITKDKRQRFCSMRCSGIANIYNKERKNSNEFKNKMSLIIKNKFKDDKDYSKRVSDGLKRYYKNNPDKIRKGSIQSKSVGNSTKGKYKKEPNNIFELSNRTRVKIIRRLNLSCCLCGWNEEICDIHHIEGRKIKDCHNHKNLTVLCPNCHRLAQSNKIDRSKLITLDIIIGNKWIEMYYG